MPWALVALSIFAFASVTSFATAAFWAFFSAVVKVLSSSIDLFVMLACLSIAPLASTLCSSMVLEPLWAFLMILNASCLSLSIKLGRLSLLILDFASVTASSIIFFWLCLTLSVIVESFSILIFAAVAFEFISFNAIFLSWLIEW